MDTQVRVVGFQTDTIMNQYAEELASAIPGYMNTIQQTIAKYAEGTELYNEWLGDPDALWSAMVTDLYGKGIFSGDSEENRIIKKAISQRLYAMEPSVE